MGLKIAGLMRIHILNPKMFSNFVKWEEEDQKVSPNIQNKLQYMASS